MNPNDLDLTNASRIYGVSNTPLFLVRKLQGDSTIRTLGKECSGQAIVDELRKILNIEPASSVDAVRPYAFLVALWFNPEIEHLKEAAKLQGNNFTWYTYIAEVLVSTFSPIHTGVIQVPGSLPSPVLSLKSNTPTTTISL